MHDGFSKIEYQKKSDQILWGEIFVELYSRLTVFALRFTNGDTYWAEDLVQDTVYRVISYAPNPTKIRNPWSYLTRTLKNLWIDGWRDRKGVQIQSLDDDSDENLLDEIPAVEPDILHNLELQDLRKRLNIAIGNLRPSEKEIFKLHLNGYDCGEIAEILNMDKNYVTYDLNAVRAKVRYRVSKMISDATPDF